MKQYKEMVQAIKERGVHKPAARENMPGTTSLFGYQFRHNLADGFPALTTKQLYWKGVVIELIWFLSGDTNIKFLDQHGVRKMWHEDAYNYYVKKCKQQNLYPVTFDDFCRIIKDDVKIETLESVHGGVLKDYTLGDCGMQYGKLWRNWEGVDREVIVLKTDNISAVQREQFKQQWLDALKENKSPILISANDDFQIQPLYKKTDQIKDLIEGLKNNPMSRRHIITAWNPATLDDMALNACHAMAQWNCRPLTLDQREIWFLGESYSPRNTSEEELHKILDNEGVPRYYLDCQMYQRSADVFLGVPLNIASYALLTEILCKICNMIPGEMIYTYGDVHIYDDHQDAINEQLSREERDLPTLRIVDEGNDWAAIRNLNFDLINMLNESDFILEDYNPHPSIKAKLSTGLK